MPKVSNARIVDFSAHRLYAAVVDVASYPRILPFIRAVRILEQTEGVTKAEVSVGLPMLSFSYVCLIHHNEPEEVKVELVSGPFKKLHAHWRFEPISDSQCRVHYALDSEFSNALMEMTAGAIFASQIHHSISAFEDALRRS